MHARGPWDSNALHGGAPNGGAAGLGNGVEGREVGVGAGMRQGLAAIRAKRSELDVRDRGGAQPAAAKEGGEEWVRNFWIAFDALDE